MSKLSLLAAALCLAAPTVVAPLAASAHPHKHHHHYHHKKKQKSARMGEEVYGYHIPGYVFVYADLDNDGVLRGRELRRARDRVIWEDRGDQHD